MMRKSIAVLCLSAVLSVLMSASAYAKVGDIGFWGGTSEGRKLPKTTEVILFGSNSKTTTDTFVYKELLLVGGEPVVAEGTMTVKDARAGIKDGETSGTYAVSYSFKPSVTSSETASLTRSITFNVNWRLEGSQTILDYTVKSWTETLETPGGSYKIDSSRSHFNVSIIEDATPGVTYAKGNISMVAVYTSGDGGSDGETVTVQSTGSIYSYDCAWSSTETHRIDTWVYAPNWQMQYQIRPSVSVNKTLQYSQNEPTAISFSGNYMEVISNKSSVSYDIFVKPNQFYNIENKGSFSISSYNSFEQLIAPDTAFLKGHFAEADISKLFSMQVLTGITQYYKPDQAITRGQFIQALVKAIKLPIEEVSTKSTKNKSVTIVFPDVSVDREEYPYIMAAYRSGLAVGRDTGNFHIDSPITRQEAIVILIRTLGLTNLGLDPTPVTTFTDDGQIASWAKRDVYAANVLGIVAGDSDGKFRPLGNVSKAEGAALINRLVDYMRYDIVTDYTDHIVNYAY